MQVVVWTMKIVPKDGVGRTPLHRASKSGHDSVVQPFGVMVPLLRIARRLAE
jgi:hypothetical protein